jgi:type IV pilus assembly protein PilO
MNLQFSKKEMLIIIAGIFLAVLLYLVVSFTYLYPLKESVFLKEQQLETEKQLQAAYEKRISSVPSGDIKSAIELQKKIPNEPFTEQLILNFEKAEVVSGSTITFMEFGDRNSGGQQDTAEDSEVESAETDTTDQNDDKSKTQVKMPDGLQKTSVTLTVESSDYEAVEKFIQILEDSKREMIVESIEFEGPEEISSDSGSKEMILFTVTVSAFYFPVMDNSNGNRMQIETPEPANKRNPFPSVSDDSEN